MPQQFFFCLQHIGDGLRSDAVAGHDRLRSGAFRFFFGQPAQIVRHGVEAGSIQRAFQGTRLPYSDGHLVDDLAQTLLVRQREFEELDQAAQFRRDRDRRRGDDDRAAIGGKLLPYIPQAAHHHRVIHVAMKILEHECRFHETSPPGC